MTAPRQRRVVGRRAPARRAQIKERRSWRTWQLLRSPWSRPSSECGSTGIRAAPRQAAARPGSGTLPPRARASTPRLRRREHHDGAAGRHDDQVRRVTTTTAAGGSTTTTAAGGPHVDHPAGAAAGPARVS